MIGNDQDSIESKLVRDILCDRKMPDVDRVERATKDSDSFENGHVSRCSLSTDARGKVAPITHTASDAAS